MNIRLGMAALALMALPLLAHASCDTVKAEIAARIKGRGTNNFSLNVVAADRADKHGEVVGQCEGDKTIVFTRSQAKANDNASRSKAKPNDDASRSKAKDYPAVNVYHAG